MLEKLFTCGLSQPRTFLAVVDIVRRLLPRPVLASVVDRLCEADRKTLLSSCGTWMDHLLMFKRHLSFIVLVGLWLLSKHYLMGGGEPWFPGKNSFTWFFSGRSASLQCFIVAMLCTTSLVFLRRKGYRYAYKAMQQSVRGIYSTDESFARLSSLCGMARFVRLCGPPMQCASMLMTNCFVMVISANYSWQMHSLTDVIHSRRLKPWGF